MKYVLIDQQEGLVAELQLVGQILETKATAQDVVKRVAWLNDHKQSPAWAHCSMEAFLTYYASTGANMYSGLQLRVFE